MTSQLKRNQVSLRNLVSELFMSDLEIRPTLIGFGNPTYTTLLVGVRHTLYGCKRMPDLR